MTVRVDTESGGPPQVHYRTCPLCEATCGLELHVVDGRVVKVKGDEEDVFSRGFVCPKGATLADLHDDPDRLRKPLIRRGDTWEEVEFDEAFAEIERRLPRLIDEYGRNSVGVYLGNPNVHNPAGPLYGRPLLKALGTKNIFSASTVDQMPRHVSSGLLYGAPGLIPVPDIDRTDFLLMLGANPWESNGSVCTAPDFPGRLRAIRERGGRFVVVDPRKTRTAKEANDHIAIRPGTDVLLLLAICETLFSEDRVDLASAEAHIDDLAALRELVTPFTPESVADRTGVDAERIRALARDLSDAPSAAVYSRIGAHTVAFGSLTSWAGDMATILTGNLDRPGGLMWTRAAHSPAADSKAKKGGGRGFLTGRWKSRVKDLPEVLGEFPVATLADEIETEGEGQIRALITVGGNPALSTPNSRRLDRALSKLDFMVSIDIYRNETSRHADVILPPPSPLERSHYDLALYGLAVRNVANYSPPVFPTEAPQESVLLARLALIAMGKGAGADSAIVDELLLGGVVDSAVGNEFSSLAGADPDALRESVSDRPPVERILDVLLRSGAYGDEVSLETLAENPHGIDLGPLQPRLPGLLRTKSGKVELTPDVIRDDFERLHDWLSRTDSQGLVLVGRRHLRSNNSWMHNIERLVRGKERCTLQVHPDDAKRLGFGAGQRVRVSSRVGSLEAPVELTEEIRPGVVSLPHGWGHDRPGVQLSVAKRYAGVNSNVLTDEEDLDRPSGTAVLNGIPVEVEPLSA